MPEKGKEIKLILTADAKPQGSYVTLSYRWGMGAIFTPTVDKVEEVVSAIQVTN